MLSILSKDQRWQSETHYKTMADCLPAWLPVNDGSCHEPPCWCLARVRHTSSHFQRKHWRERLVTVRLIPPGDNLPLKKCDAWCCTITARAPRCKMGEGEVIRMDYIEKSRSLMCFSVTLDWGSGDSFDVSQIRIEFVKNHTGPFSHLCATCAHQKRSCSFFGTNVQRN